MKLNEVAIWTAIFIGVFVGWLTSSWLIFLLVTAGLVAAAICRNDIRLTPQRPRGQRRRR